MSRLFDEKDLSQKLNRRHRRKILRVLKGINENPSRYIFAIDDTLIAHWGKNIWGAYSWKDHKSNGYLFGHKLLVLGIVDTKRKVLIPLFWEILHRKIQSEEDDENQKNSYRAEDHDKGWEVAMRLLKEAVAFGFPKLPVVLDSWFAGREFFEQLTQEGFRFVMEIKNNRKVHGHGRQKLDESVSDFFSNRFRFSTTACSPISIRMKSITRNNNSRPRSSSLISGC